MLISLLDVKFFSLKMLSNYFTEMFFFSSQKGTGKEKNPRMEALRKTVPMLRYVLGTLLSCEVPDNVQLRSPPRCEGGLARSFFLLLIWGNFLEIPIPQHGGLDHSRSMASKTEGKNLWSLRSSSGKDKSQSFPTAMKVAEAMVQHKVVGKNYRASPASTRLFFFVCFFFHCFLKEVPQTSHLMWSLYYVWTLGTQQTKRKGNQTPFFSSGSIFPSCSQSLKLLVILFRDTFAMWANSVFSVFLKLHSLAVPFFVIIFFLFFSSSSKTSKWYCSQSSSKRTKSSAFSFITIL